MTVLTISFVTLLPWLSFLCQHIQANHLCAKNLQSLYDQHLADSERVKYAWYIRARKMGADRLIKSHERKETRQAKEKKKEKKKAFIIKKRAENFICRRCSSHFDSNSKLHQHIWKKYAKKLALVLQLSLASISSSSFTSSIFSQFFAL